ncbi:MAG: hypothetical protein H7293_02930 [Candidatus Saccharibacteria bacterium]|nr:hypothetical protein [Rhodoferax sp.]
MNLRATLVGALGIWLFAGGQIHIRAHAQSLSRSAPPMQTCVDAVGRTTLSDRACPPDTVANGRTPRLVEPVRHAPTWATLTPQQRKLWLAQAQLALETEWQKEVSVRTDVGGLIVHNRTQRDVYWFIMRDEPIGWIPLSLDNRIAPGITQRFDRAGTEPGLVYRFYWWYKGDELEAGSGIYGPDWVRKVLVQIPSLQVAPAKPH